MKHEITPFIPGMHQKEWALHVCQSIRVCMHLKLGQTFDGGQCDGEWQSHGHHGKADDCIMC